MRVSIYSKGSVPQGDTRIFLQKKGGEGDPEAMDITDSVTSLSVTMAHNERTMVTFELLVDGITVELDEAEVLERSGKRIDFDKLQEARRASEDA